MAGNTWKRLLPPGIAWILSGLLIAGSSGCIYIPIPKPPFDASGSYSGTWEGTVVSSGYPVHCFLQITLSQQADESFPRNYQLEGAITFDWACDSVQEAFRGAHMPPASTIPISGYMLANGNLLLNIIFSDDDATYAVDVGADCMDFSGDDIVDRISGDVTMNINPAHGWIQYIKGFLDLTRIP